MPRLNTVDLRLTAISAVGLKHLIGLSRLDYLELDSTRIGSAGLEAFRKAIPECIITSRR